MLKIDNDNYFEVAEAIHAWLTLNHEGQASDTYRMLCQSEFKPGMLWSESDVELENEYYPEINDKNIESLFNQLTDFLNERENQC